MPAKTDSCRQSDIRNYFIRHTDTVNIFDSSRRAEEVASAEMSSPCEAFASLELPPCQKTDTCQSRNIRNYFTLHSDTVNIFNAPQRADENASVESSQRAEEVAAAEQSPLQTCHRKQKYHRRMNNFVEHTSFAKQGCSNCVGETYRFEKCNAKARFRCKECGLPFASANDLTQHLRIPTGKRPYACPYDGCNDNFKRKDHLAEHQRRHTGEMPFLCEYCGRQFRKRATLAKHIVSLHSSERNHGCDCCAKTFKRNDELMRHLRKSLGLRYTCIVCGKTLRTRNEHTNHYVEAHPVILE